MGKRSERRSAGSQSVRARALLTECRALALESLLEHLNNAVEQLAAAVLAARTNADPNEPQSPLFRAIETVYNHRAEFVATFGREYRTHLDKPRDDEVTGSPSATEQTLLTEMALVETDAMDLLLLSSDLTRRALNQIESDMEGSGEQYWALRLRVGQISDSESLDIRDNPLAVQRVMHALVAASATYFLDYERRRALLLGLLPDLVTGINECYVRVNEFLISQEVLPSMLSAVTQMMASGFEVTDDSARMADESTRNLRMDMALQSMLRQQDNPAARLWASALGGTANTVAEGADRDGRSAAARLLVKASSAWSGGGWGGYGGGGPRPGAPGASIQVLDWMAAHLPAQGQPGWSAAGPATVPMADYHSAGQAAPPDQADVADRQILTGAVAEFLGRVARGPQQERRYVAQMMAEPGAYMFEPALAIPPSSALLDRLNEQQRSAAASALSALAQAQSGEGEDASGVELPEPPPKFGFDEAVKADAGPLDALTAEFVQALFESLADDAMIGTGARSVLALLQTIAVKSAILDRTFFASRNHPMRRLLDNLTEAVRDPDIDSSDGSEFVVALNDLVAEINEKFTDDLSLIALAADQIELISERYKVDKPADPGPDPVELERVERELVAATEVNAELAQRVPDDLLPFLRTFLIDWWSRALTQSYIFDKLDEDSWDHRLDTIDKLVWSVGDGGPDELPRLRVILPLLVKTLSRGVADAGMPVIERDAFFGNLMKTHRDVIAHWRDKHASEKYVAEAHEGGAAWRSEVAGQPVAADEIALDSSSYAHRMVDELEIGTVLEFVSSDVAGNVIWQPLRLSWISPRRTIFLFTARLTKARQLNRDALAQALDGGTVRLLERGNSFLDRSIEAVIRV